VFYLMQLETMVFLQVLLTWVVLLWLQAGMALANPNDYFIPYSNSSFDVRLSFDW
jgi:hypothetical protein